MTPEKYKQLSIKEFTAAAKIYDSNHAGIYEMCKDDYPPILAELEKEPFHDVLDCGCGTGPMIELLHEKYPEKHYVGLDLTPEMINVAQAKKLSNTEFVVGRQRESPLPGIFLRRGHLLEQLSSLPQPTGFFQQCLPGSPKRRSSRSA